MLSRQLPTRGPGVDLEDLRDRAQSFREFVLRRIHVDELSMHPFNRGGAGIVPYHVHHVANDCLENRTSLQRYGHVCVKEIPPAQRKVVIDFNAHKARGNPLLPKVHPDRLRYVRTLFFRRRTSCTPRSWPETGTARYTTRARHVSIGPTRTERDVRSFCKALCAASTAGAVHGRGRGENPGAILGASWGVPRTRALITAAHLFQCGSVRVNWPPLAKALRSRQWAAVGRSGRGTAQETSKRRPSRRARRDQNHFSSRC